MPYKKMLEELHLEEDGPEPTEEVAKELWKTRRVFKLLVLSVNELRHRVTRTVLAVAIAGGLTFLVLLGGGYTLNCRAIQSLGHGNQELWGPLIKPVLDHPELQPPEQVQQAKRFKALIDHQASKDCWPLWD